MTYTFIIKRQEDNRMANVNEPYLLVSGKRGVEVLVGDEAVTKQIEAVDEKVSIEA